MTDNDDGLTEPPTERPSAGLSELLELPLSDLRAGAFDEMFWHLVRQGRELRALVDGPEPAMIFDPLWD